MYSVRHMASNQHTPKPTTKRVVSLAVRVEEGRPPDHFWHTYFFIYPAPPQKALLTAFARHRVLRQSVSAWDVDQGAKPHSE